MKKFLILFYITKPCFRLASGGWFVFRDSPDWVVEMVAKEDTTGKEHKLRAMALVSEARKEAKSRGLI